MANKRTRKTPTNEKVHRRLFEKWEIIRRSPSYRKAFQNRDSVTLAQFGIDADPTERAPIEILDLLKATYTDYSIDAQKVVSGALLLSETPWFNETGEMQWKKIREAVFLLDPTVTLEEVREGVERVLKLRRPYWIKGRHLIGRVVLASPRLVDPNDVGDLEAEKRREMLNGYRISVDDKTESLFKSPYPPLLIVDPLQLLGQMRQDIHTILKEWNIKRPRPKKRWRRTTSRDIDSFDSMVETLAATGRRSKDLYGRVALSRNQGLSEDQARRSLDRARQSIGRIEDAAQFEHTSTCAKYRSGKSCHVCDSLLDRIQGITSPRERFIAEYPQIKAETSYPFSCPGCGRVIYSDDDAVKNHIDCAKKLKASP
jgi:hypothetical protein